MATPVSKPLPSTRQVRLAAFVLVPLALYLALRSQASWRPYTVFCGDAGRSVYLSAAYAPDGRTVAIASAGRIRLWDVARCHFVRELRLDHEPGRAGIPLQAGIAFAPGGRDLVTSYNAGAHIERIVWNADTGQTSRIPLRSWLQADQFSLVSGSPDQRPTLVRVGIRQTVQARDNYWRVLLGDAVTGRMLRTFIIFTTTEPTTSAVTPDGSTIALGGCSADGGQHSDIRLYDTRSGRKRAIFPAASGFAPLLAFTGDSQGLVIGGRSGTIISCLLRATTLQRTLTGHTAAITALAISPDGMTLASGSADKTVKLWRLADGRLLRTLHSHTGTVESLSFAGDGSYLASSSGDGTVKLWRIR